MTLGTHRGDAAPLAAMVPEEMLSLYDARIVAAPARHFDDTS